MSFNKSEAVRNAEKFLAQGKIRQAVSEYQEIVKRDPDDITNLNILGDLLIKANQTDDALKCFCRVAEHYNQKGFPQKAIAVYNKIFRYKPDCTDTLETLADLNRAKGAIAEARAQYKKLAEFYEKLGDTTKLITAWQSLTTLDKQNSDICIKLGELCRKHSRSREAADAFAEAGDRLFAKNDLDKSLEAFSAALEEEPEHVKGFQGFVRIALVRGTYMEAVDKLEDILNDQPENSDLRELLAECYLEMGEVFKAEDILMGLVTKDASRYKHLLRILKTHLVNGETKSAMRILSMTADHLLSDNDPDRLLEWTNAILEREPSNLDAMRLQARYYTSKGDVLSATAILDQISVMAAKSVAQSAPMFDTSPAFQLPNLDSSPSLDEGPKGLEMFSPEMPDYSYENQTGSFDAQEFGESGVDEYKVEDADSYFAETAEPYVSAEPAREYSVSGFDADEPSVETSEGVDASVFGEQEEGPREFTYFDESVTSPDAVAESVQTAEEEDCSKFEAEDAQEMGATHETESVAAFEETPVDEEPEEDRHGFEIVAITHEIVGGTRRGRLSEERGDEQAAPGESEASFEAADDFNYDSQDVAPSGEHDELDGIPEIDEAHAFAFAPSENISEDVIDETHDDAAAEEAAETIEVLADDQSFDDFELGFTCSTLDSLDVCVTGDLEKSVGAAESETDETVASFAFVDDPEAEEFEAEFAKEETAISEEPAFVDHVEIQESECGHGSSDEETPVHGFVEAFEFESTSLVSSEPTETPLVSAEIEFNSQESDEAEVPCESLDPELATEPSAVFEFGTAVEFESTQHEEGGADILLPKAEFEFNGYSVEPAEDLSPEVMSDEGEVTSFDVTGELPYSFEATESESAEAIPAAEETEEEVAAEVPAQFEYEHFVGSEWSSSAHAVEELAEKSLEADQTETVEPFEVAEEPISGDNPFAPRIEFDFGAFTEDEGPFVGAEATESVAPTPLEEEVQADSFMLETKDELEEAVEATEPTRTIEEVATGFEPESSADVYEDFGAFNLNASHFNETSDLNGHANGNGNGHSVVELAENEIDFSGVFEAADAEPAQEEVLEYSDEEFEAAAPAVEADEFDLDESGPSDIESEYFVFEETVPTAELPYVSDESPMVELSDEGQDELQVPSIAWPEFGHESAELDSPTPADEAIEPFSVTTNSFESRIDQLVAEMNLTFSVSETVETDESSVTDLDPVDSVEPAFAGQLVEKLDHTGAEYLAPATDDETLDWEMPFDLGAGCYSDEFFNMPIAEEAMYPKTASMLSDSETLAVPLESSHGDVSDIQAREDRLAGLLDTVDFFINEGFFEVAKQSFEAVVAEFGHRPQFAELEDRLALFNSHYSEEASAPVRMNANASLLSVEPELYDPDFPELSTLGMYTPEEIKNMVQVVEIDEEVIFDHETFFDTATAYREMGLTDYAIREFENALKLVRPDDGTKRFFHCCNMLGHCFMDCGKPDLAVMWFRRAQEIPGLSADEDLALLYEIAKALEAHGKTTEAASLLGQIHATSEAFHEVNDLFRRLTRN